MRQQSKEGADRSAPGIQYQRQHLCLCLCIVSLTLGCSGPQVKADNDRDRIPDACDRCPNEPEDVDCPVGDGCPGSHCRGSCLGESSYTQWRVAVLFNRTEASLYPSADKVLARVAKKMQDPKANLFICSQCARGPAGALFLRRVKSVRDDLRGRGVSSSRVDAGLHCLQRAPAVDSLDLYVITISAPASR